jgi:hypothetical protein
MAPGSQYATVGNLNMANAYSSGELGMSPMGGGYTPSTFGYLAAGAAGVYAGYNRWQGSNKDFGGALGGVAYGVGTYGAALGAGALATTGSLSVGLAAIPVVGWIALAAMAVDMLSGGKLFGTKGKLHHTNMTLDVGAEGIDLAQSYTLKGQKAFFGGTKWTTNSIQPSAEAIAAAQEFYDALVKERDSFAKAFNAQVGDLVGGTFNAEYDKNGNLKSSSSTVLGVTYAGETQDQFTQRLMAENQIAVLSQFDSKISELADSVRKSVDALSQYAQQYATAVSVTQSALAQGMDLLATTGPDTVASVLDLARANQAYGESIDQTTQRILQAQAQYDQFVAQFKPAATYVDDFEGSLAAIRDSMKGAMDQANALARAAGAQGAATKDLVNIQQRAAQQMAAAIKQLEGQAQTLAFNLGLTTVGSLDQVSAEIERLQAKAGQGAGAVRDFGAAMQSASERASQAISLLIGDLSPLNDMQKLEEARKGLMAGLVTQEQFLTIARRLYASSSQYNQEFAFAQQFGGQGAAHIGNRGGGSAGLTAAESHRLQLLLDQQSQLQQAASLAQYQTLAQQIAEIASAKGEDYMKVIQDMGIDLKALEKGLGLANDDALKAFIETRQKQLDSDGENTRSIIDKIQELIDVVRQAGGLPTEGDHSGHARPDSTGVPIGGIGRGVRALSEDDYDGIGEAVYRAVNRAGPGDRRNGRGAAA